MVEYLLGTEKSDSVKGVVRDRETDLNIPALCDVEFVAALRRCIADRLISSDRAVEALDDYLDLALTRHGHRSLVKRIFELRSNFSAYDAAYVSLAENLKAELLTEDGHLRRAVKTHTRVKLAN